ncbi:MAG: hypothetical protein OEZ01_17755, partial [Candidatus Heimdallarchaeota archaeon]|nr:hypothetical protein [Candidatus Heimdallarchaeota archaeon]
MSHGAREGKTQVIVNAVTSNLNGIKSYTKELKKLEKIDEILEVLCDKDTPAKIKALLTSQHNETSGHQITAEELARSLFKHYVEQFSYLLAHKSFECKADTAFLMRKKLLGVISGVEDSNVRRCLLHSVLFSLGNNKYFMGDGLAFRRAVNSVGVSWPLVAIGGLYRGDLSKSETEQVNHEARLLHQYIEPRSLDKKTSKARKNVLGKVQGGIDSDAEDLGIENDVEENVIITPENRAKVLTKTIKALKKEVVKDALSSFVCGEGEASISERRRVYDNMVYFQGLFSSLSRNSINDNQFRQYIYKVCNIKGLGGSEIDRLGELHENLDHHTLCDILSEKYKEFGIPEEHKDSPLIYLKNQFKEMFFKYGRARDANGKLLILKIIAEQKENVVDVGDLLNLLQPLLDSGIVTSREDINEIFSHFTLLELLALCDNHPQMLSDYLYSLSIADLSNKINTLNDAQKAKLLEILKERKDLSFEDKVLFNLVYAAINDQDLEGIDKINEELFLAVKNGFVAPNTLPRNVFDSVCDADVSIAFAQDHNVSFIDL